MYYCADPSQTHEREKMFFNLENNSVTHQDESVYVTPVQLYDPTMTYTQERESRNDSKRPVFETESNATSSSSVSTIGNITYSRNTSAESTPESISGRRASLFSNSIELHDVDPVYVPLSKYPPYSLQMGNSPAGTCPNNFVSSALDPGILNQSDSLESHRNPCTFQTEQNGRNGKDVFLQGGHQSLDNHAFFESFPRHPVSAFRGTTLSMSLTMPPGGENARIFNNTASRRPRIEPQQTPIAYSEMRVQALFPQATQQNSELVLPSETMEYGQQCRQQHHSSVRNMERNVEYNVSPYVEGNKVELMTEMYRLKQITSSSIYPQADIIDGTADTYLGAINGRIHSPKSPPVSLQSEAAATLIASLSMMVPSQTQLLSANSDTDSQFSFRDASMSPQEHGVAHSAESNEISSRQFSGTTRHYTKRQDEPYPHSKKVEKLQGTGAKYTDNSLYTSNSNHGQKTEYIFPYGILTQSTRTVQNYGVRYQEPWGRYREDGVGYFNPNIEENTHPVIHEKRQEGKYRDSYSKDRRDGKRWRNYHSGLVVGLSMVPMMEDKNPTEDTFVENSDMFATSSLSHRNTPDVSVRRGRNGTRTGSATMENTRAYEEELYPWLEEGEDSDWGSDDEDSTPKGLSKKKKRNQTRKGRTPVFVDSKMNNKTCAIIHPTESPAMIARSGKPIVRIRMGKRTATSQYRGVAMTRSGAWRVQVGHKGARISVGHFEDEMEAARAYDRVARSLHGESAALNFPDIELTEEMCTDATNIAVSNALSGTKANRSDRNN